MTTTSHTYHEDAAWNAQAQSGAWMLTVGRFTDDDTYCIDFYNSFNGERTRKYFTTREDAFTEFDKWLKH